MILVTTDFITGKEIATLGLVRGNTIQCKHIGRDIGAGFKQFVGGELKGYTDMMTESREIATARMIEDATALGADAIVGVRYASSNVMESAAEVLAYGTAVKFVGE